MPRRKKAAPVIAVKCDYCGSETETFVVTMQCGSVDAIIEDDNGRMRVVKIVKDKYGDYTK